MGANKWKILELNDVLNIIRFVKKDLKVKNFAENPKVSNSFSEMELSSKKTLFIKNFISVLSI